MPFNNSTYEKSVIEKQDKEIKSVIVPMPNDCLCPKCGKVRKRIGWWWWFCFTPGCFGQIKHRHSEIKGGK